MVDKSPRGQVQSEDSGKNSELLLPLLTAAHRLMCMAPLWPISNCLFEAQSKRFNLEDSAKRKI